MARRTVTAGAATLSWINPVTGLPEVDKGGDPGDEIGANEIVDGKKYRFSNFLQVEVLIEDDSRIVNTRFTEKSGMYRGPSFLRLDSAPVGQIGRSAKSDGRTATFRQLVGCRTESPEKIGRGAGGVGGAAVGGIGAYMIGGALGGPIGVGVAALAIGAVGWFTGGEIAELASAFPPIWSELELVVSADGSVKARLVSHSLFPSNTAYLMAPPKAVETPPAKYARLQAGIL